MEQARPYRNTPEHFWRKVRKTRTCWHWMGLRKQGAYGVFRWHGAQYQTHRLSWEWEHGPIPSGMFVCHTCDVKWCVNPSHLFLGTTTDNIRDAGRKFRLGKVRPPQLKTIYEMLDSGFVQQKIADKFSVSQGCISFIKRNRGRFEPMLKAFMEARNGR